MEIKQFIQIKKEIYSSIMDFIDTTENVDIDMLINNLEQHEILKNKEEILSTLQLLSKIADNHHRLPDFINKIRKIIQYLLQTIRSEISDYKIYQIFENNKRILLLLLEEKIIQPDEEIISNLMKTKDKNNFPYSHYLYSEIKSFINEDGKKKIENEIKQKYNEEITNFEEKCRIGENGSYVCSLIRQDSAEEFISYVNQTKTSLSSRIQPSIFETNLFLMEKTPTLIEYASFFGSIQIIRYLRYMGVSLTNSMWLYIIHSNNAELIHFLEENEIKPEKNSQMEKLIFGHNWKHMINHKNNDKPKANITYEKVYEESILCHHNSIADYIKDNFLDRYLTTCFERNITLSLNYYYFPVDIEYIVKIISRTKNSIGFYISQLCHSLTQITIPSSVTKIGNYSFSGCSSLTQIAIPSSVISIRNYAFSGCSSLAQITIPSSVTFIGNHAFNGCSSLTQITIPSSVTSIRNYAFSGCSSLTQITIPSYVTLIGDYAFSGCSSLTQITIPSSVISIGDSAFSGCSSLSDEKIKSFDSNKSNININNDNSKIKSTWKPKSNYSKYMISPMATKNNISWNQNNKPHNTFDFGGNISSQKYAWKLNSKNTNRNAFSWGTNNNKSTLDNKNNQKIMNEFEILKMLDHPNVLKAVDIIYNDKKIPSILYEEYSTDLKHAIQNKIFSKIQLVYSIFQIAEGMKYIHSRKIIHLNLNPTNILISEDGTIKISDFQNAEKITSENEIKEIDDVYSFGEIVYFILSGSEINDSEKDSVLESFPLLAQQLIEACFLDAENRPTFDMICDVMEQNNFNLISLSQQEIDDVSKLISQYR